MIRFRNLSWVELRQQAAQSGSGSYTREFRARSDPSCMKPSRFLIPAVFALLLCAPGCLFRTRTVEVRLSTAKLQTATQQELIDRLNHDAAQVKTLNATVDIDTSVGGAKRGKVTEFKEIRGYILVRKPNMLRMIGLYPIVRNKAFDMVSDGDEFKLSVPATNKFYIGHNQVSKTPRTPWIHSARKPFTMPCSCRKSTPRTKSPYWRAAPKWWLTPRERSW